MLVIENLRLKDALVLINQHDNYYFNVSMTLEFPNGDIYYFSPNCDNIQKYVIEALIGEGVIK